MRRLLVVAAIVAASLPATASAWPPECDPYSDKPCFTVCEMWQRLEPLFDELPVSIC